MDRDKVIDPSNEHVMRALSRISEAFENEPPVSADAAFVLLRERLFEIRPNEAAKNAGLPGGDVVNFVPRLDRDSGVHAVLRWLKETKGFREKELELARRTGILVERSDGLVVVRDQPLTDAWASAMIAGISLLTGAWITWVCFGTEGSPEVILESFIIGSFFGAVVGKALDKSFRFAKLRVKILSAAPRLGEGVSVRS